MLIYKKEKEQQVIAPYNAMKLCMGCMEYMAEGLNVCPLCGYAENTPPKEIYHMHPGTILHKKYIVGKVLGYGGFGVTYIGWDYGLNRKVAIKEFLPGEFSTRMPGETIVTVYDGEATAQFEAGLERFVEEAQRLARFNYVPGVVDIHDTFIENNTGYIVMQCLEGDTIKELIDKYGVMPYESAKLIMVEVLKTLAIVHQEGIIHRDISPDNIFITNKNEIKLLDFGAARYASTYHSKSLSVILKPGYAPEEQYRSHGNQGPWSDVYAAAATFYKMITGITIEEAMERTVKDDVQSPLELGVDLSESANNAIMNALNIHAEMRTQSCEDFANQLTADDVERIVDLPKKSEGARIPLWLKLGTAAVLSFAALFGLLIVTGVLDIAGIFYNGPKADASTRVPYVINNMMDAGEKILNDGGFAMQISDQAYDEFAPKDIIKSQTPDSGGFGRNCEEKDNNGRPVVFVIVSGGHAPVMVPDVVGKTLDEAEKILKKLGFEIKTEEEYSETEAKGTVLLQDIVDVEYAYGSTIILTVSKGKMKVDASKSHKIPDLVGMNYDEAVKKLMSIGMYAERKEEPSSKKENQVLKQSEKKGSEQSEGTTVVLTVSSNTIVVPNVVYKEEAVARRLITEAGAKVTVTYEKNDQVKSGNVISQSIIGKSTYGKTVKLVVSTGFDDAAKKASELKKQEEQRKAKEKAEREAKEKAQKEKEEKEEKEKKKREEEKAEKEKKQKEEEKKKLEEEKKKLEEEKKKTEALEKRKAELAEKERQAEEKRKKEQAERERQAEEQRKLEQQRKEAEQRKLEQQRKIDAEKRAKEEEQRRKKQEKTRRAIQRMEDKLYSAEKERDIVEDIYNEYERYGKVSWQTKSEADTAAYNAYQQYVNAKKYLDDNDIVHTYETEYVYDLMYKIQAVANDADRKAKKIKSYDD